MKQIPNIIEQKFDQLVNLCKQFWVLRLYSFGSVVTDNFDPLKSDLDFKVELTEMPPLLRGENLMKLWDALEALFNRKVDLITDQPISNIYLKHSIEQSKVLIYERAGEEILS